MNIDTVFIALGLTELWIVFESVSYLLKRTVQKNRIKMSRTSNHYCSCPTHAQCCAPCGVLLKGWGGQQ